MKITTIKYSFKELASMLAFYVIILLIISLFLHMVFGFHAIPLISGSITVLVMFFITITVNKNAVLTIDKKWDTDKLKNATLPELFEKKGLVKVSESDNETRYDRKGRVSRALSNLFKDYVVIRDSSEGLKVYGKKQFLISLKMNIRKE